MAGNLGGQKCFPSWKIGVGEFHEPIARNYLSPFVYHDAAFWLDEPAALRGVRGPREVLPRPFFGIVLPAGVTARRVGAAAQAQLRRATISSMAQTWSASPAPIAGVTRKV